MLSEQNLSLLKESAEYYGLSVTPGQLEKFSKYAELLTEWNEKINLTAIIDPEGIVIKHFSDSLSIMPLIPREAKTFIDIGTGAGFPGIPLKIMQDHLKVTLLDSLGKRVKFLNEVCEKLSLKGIESFHGRAEDYGTDKNYREKYDVASARAVASLPVLLEYCLPFVKVGGLFIGMKGPDAKDEINESKKALQVLGGELLEVKNFNLPNSDYERYVVLVKKCRHTPPSYPRKSGKPTKMPIK